MFLQSIGSSISEIKWLVNRIPAGFFPLILLLENIYKSFRFMTAYHLEL